MRATEHTGRSALRLAPGSRVLLSATSSDSHTWNLVFLELLIAEHDHEVLNLGACTPVPLLVGECMRWRPDLVVLSSVNGHGATDGATAARSLRRVAVLRSLAIVIGGRLTTDDSLDADERRALLDAGIDAVFTGPAAADHFCRVLAGGHGELAAA
jgi:methylaspartate mutase sigma subunit